MTPARTGQITQVAIRVIRVPASVSDSENRFQPTMAPTMACVVETGRLALVIR